MTNKILSLSNVGKKFHDEIILKDVNLEINRGEVIGIVGKNGSGKTTLLRIILGLNYANEGEVIVGEKKVTPGILGDLPVNVGALIETPKFLPQFSGLKNLSMLALIKDVISEKDIRNVIRRVGLNPESKIPVSKYSLGMRQRLGIAQAIMENPELILFDEPTNALDTTGVETFSEIVKELSNKGTSFIIVSHRKEEIDMLCDKVYKIENSTLTIFKS